MSTRSTVAWPREALAAALRGDVSFDEPLARHTSYGVGGPVDAWVEPADVADLAACLRFCSSQRVPCAVVGGGSNLLVSDQGLPGVAVRLGAASFAFCRSVTPPDRPDVRLLHVGAGLPVGRLVALARQEGLADLVFLAGIPGTLGGALRMNAGTTAGQLSDVLQRVELVLADGREVALPAAECGLAYRSSRLPAGAVAVGLHLRVHLADRDGVAATIDRYLERRRSTQPGGATAGCVFKNPAGAHAGRLIDAAGLKGLQVGGARVSDVHANFIVASPGASAADVAAVVDRVRRAIHGRHGIWLQTENVLLGFDDGGEPTGRDEEDAAPLVASPPEATDGGSS